MALAVSLFAAFSKKAQRRPLTPPMFFLAAPASRAATIRLPIPRFTLLYACEDEESHAQGREAVRLEP
jgi:hypothetical protein